MEIDASSSRQSSQDYDYTVDGGIPDAQFDEAMNSFLDDALVNDVHLDGQAHHSAGDGKSDDQKDSEVFEEDVAREGDDEDDGNASSAASDLSGSELSEDDRHDITQSRSPSSVKRRENDISIERPFKRKCTGLTVGYLELLNKEIKEASLRGCTEDKDVDEDGIVAYRASELGLTIWSPIEKRILYELTSRLGRNSVAEIAAAIGTKSVVEVEDYLCHLHHASEERKSKLRAVLQSAETPAAMELSPQCCHALNEAADTLSIMQERKEQQREEDKWGPGWNFTQTMFLETAEDGGQLLNERISEIGDLFDIPKWLTLSSNIFMNSAVPSNNWMHVDEEPPTIWATALEDFHALAISITKRLVQTTLFIATSRLRTKREAEPRIQGIVRREDVEAALQSLNMGDKRLEFWRGCARRLRLNVRDSESRLPHERRKDGLNGREYMTFDEVETALGDESLEIQSVGDLPGNPEPSLVNELMRTPDDGVTENEADVESSGPAETSRRYTSEELAIRNEAEEIILFSGVDFPQSTRSKEVLLNRISGERCQEEHANQCDEQASREEEIRMWELLEKPVPQVLRTRETPEQVPRSNLGVDGVYSVGRNWSQALHYYAEWETEHVDDHEH